MKPTREQKVERTRTKANGEVREQGWRQKARARVENDRIELQANFMATVIARAIAVCQTQGVGRFRGAASIIHWKAGDMSSGLLHAAVSYIEAEPNGARGAPNYQ